MNHLSKESSPYLLQHANNPVDWYPWGLEALNKAKIEGKLIIVSIGYSACHWCHVMEHESFENDEVAAIMNEYFVCIKVDREERPDIDQIYMNAVQLMNGQGGWPLNCITLPDQRPIYGGTYFKKNDWISILKNIADFHVKKPNETEEYASKLTEGIRKMELIPKNNTQQIFSKEYLKEIVNAWKPYFDYSNGGHNRAPKFPMPNNFLFLLRYAHFSNDEAIHAIVQLTLEKMAMGGIYDQIKGGFCRYSVDDHWLVPHFEKMLYDNAQLISLYSEAFSKYKNPLYKRVIQQTIQFCLDEWYITNQGFQSATDADSEGVEGKYYCWSKKEIKELLKDHAEIYCAYYQIFEEANWEHDFNILHRKYSDDAIAEQFNMEKEKLLDIINECNKIVQLNRQNRIKPGIDDKLLTSWNALMINALCEAYKVLGVETYKEIAISTAKFIHENLMENGKIKRTYKNKAAKINGFLDDYAITAEAFLALYEITFDENWLILSSQLIETCLIDFYDSENGMFFYTSIIDEALIARKHEVTDNVIPSSNSVIANVLFKLGIVLERIEWKEMAIKNLQSISTKIKVYGSSYSNWANLLLLQIYTPFEIVISGKETESFRKNLATYYIPNKIICGSEVDSNLPLLLNRFTLQTKIYVCKDQNCQLPVGSVDEALELIE